MKLLPAGFFAAKQPSEARTVKKPRGATASMAFAIIYVLNEVKNDGKMAVAESKKTIRRNGFLCCFTERGLA